MKYICFCIITFVCVHAAKAQSYPILDTLDPSESPAIKRALAIRDRGDLAYSAEMLSFLVAHAEDKRLIAEAIYWLIDTGDLAADRMNGRLGSAPIKWRVDSLRTKWSRRQWELNNQYIDLLKSSGINVIPTQVVELVYVNDASDYFNELFTKHGSSKWAENENAEYVWRIGLTMHDSKPVIEAGHAFLQKYPQSIYLETVYSALGCAYKDEWNWSGGKDEMREEAIKYYKLAKELSTDETSKSSYQRNIDELESDRHLTDACFVVP